MADLSDKKLDRRDILKAGGLAALFSSLKVPGVVAASSSLLSACGTEANKTSTSILVDNLRAIGLLVREYAHIGPKTIIIFGETHDLPTQKLVVSLVARSKELAGVNFVALEGIRDDISAQSYHIRNSQDILQRANARIINPDDAVNLFGLRITKCGSKESDKFNKVKLIEDIGLARVALEDSGKLFDEMCYVQYLNETYETIINSLRANGEALISFHCEDLPTWVSYAGHGLAAFQDFQATLKSLCPDLPILDFDKLVKIPGKHEAYYMRGIDNRNSNYFGQVYSEFDAWTRGKFLEKRSERFAERILKHMKESGGEVGAVICGLMHTIRDSQHKSFQEYIEAMGNGEYSYVVVDPFSYEVKKHPFMIVRSA
ncbi:MAG: hypothetical protein KDD56_02900 [Bdellovibrionales bacterium]|nr:hypothetical protein [Bdellovibrionales bacterium]